MTTDYRALCAELAELDGHCVVDCTTEWADVMCRVRAALAQPEPVGPTDEELGATYFVGRIDGGQHAAHEGLSERETKRVAHIAGLRAVLRLARWGRPAITPIPVSERLPGAEDCDADGRCYVWDWLAVIWTHTTWESICSGGWGDTHWLPARALPLPGQPAPDALAP